MLLIILLSVLCGSLYVYLRHKLSYWKKRNVPFKTPNLLLGNLSGLALQSESVGKYFGKLYHEFDGPYFGFYSFVTPILVIKDPDLVKRILVKDFNVFQNRFIVSDEKIDPLLSSGLLAVTTPNWKPIRSKVSQVFSTGNIKNMFYLMVECQECLTDYININENESMELTEMASKYTADVIMSCIFGISENSFVKENVEFRIAREKLFRGSLVKAVIALSYFLAPVLVKIFKFKFIDDVPAEYLRKMCNQAIAQREKSKTNYGDLIDILVELKNAETKNSDFKFSSDQLVAQAAVFFIGALDTTSSVVVFTFYELSINGDIQRRLRSEIGDVIGLYGELTYEAIHAMPYLHMIVCETLRKYPLIPLISRYAETDYLIPETGLVIEKGTPVIIPQHGFNWDSKYFPKPEVYDPERFNQMNKAALRYAYVPFGDGSRRCIGERFALLASKLAITQIVRNFEIERNTATKVPLVFDRSGILHATPGVFVTFKKFS